MDIVYRRTLGVLRFLGAAFGFDSGFGVTAARFAGSPSSCSGSAREKLFGTLRPAGWPGDAADAAAEAPAALAAFLRQHGTRAVGWPAVSGCHVGQLAEGTTGC